MCIYTHTHILVDVRLSLNETVEHVIATCSDNVDTVQLSENGRKRVGHLKCRLSLLTYSVFRVKEYYSNPDTEKRKRVPANLNSIIG